MSRYRTVIVGCGDRGDSHAQGFAANSDRFDLVACCDRHPERMAEMVRRYGVARTYDDAETMLDRERPDIFCFATLPSIRLSLVELGIRYGVKVIAFEKPMANELEEAREIYDRCKAAGVKFIISHQQKYDRHWQNTKEIVDSGEIGEIVKIHGTARPWLGEAGTHLMDYLMWFNGGSRVEWVVAQAIGTRMLDESHPSADFVTASMEFANGVRGVFECGAHAPHLIAGPNPLKTMDFWTDSSITIHGTLGYAQVINGRGWRALTKSSGGRVLSGESPFDPVYQQPLYIRDLADWLDGKIAMHPCDGELSYHGFEATMALYLSALDRRIVRLPLDTIPAGSLVARLRNELPPSDEYRGQ